MATTQLRQVINHIEKHGSITSWDAISYYGITRLAHWVYTFNRDPDEPRFIYSKWESHNGERWKRYFFKIDK